MYTYLRTSKYDHLYTKQFTLEECFYMLKRKSLFKFSLFSSFVANDDDGTYKTAVLLQSMLIRIEQLETQLQNVISNSTSTFAKMVKDIKRLNKTILVNLNNSGVAYEVICEVPTDALGYPHCKEKVKVCVCARLSSCVRVCLRACAYVGFYSRYTSGFRLSQSFKMNCLEIKT